MRLLTLLAVGTLITTVTAQIAQPIVERKEYYAGDTFNITCDITKFSGPLSTSPYIFTMSLMRQTLTETKLQTLTETKFSTLAIYQPFAAPNEHNITTLPSGKQWIVQYSGGDGYTNRQTMKIVTTVVGLRCDDAGLYKCALTFPGSLTPIDSNVVNLTTKAQISQDDMIVTPRNGDNPYSSYYNLGENENTTITLTCNFQGPTDLTAVWKFSKDSNEPDYLPLNGIVNETPVTTSAGCTSSSYKSILTFQLQADHGETTYFCTVVENNVEMSRANFTIGISQTTEAPSTGGQTASGSVNVGAIVGGVIGGVVFLIIVIVLIYFFVIRRKRQGGGEEKRKDLETTDSGKDNNFTPPPVFYSKPHKPPKDERDGSRPVGMTNEGLDTSYDSKDLKGPPQYTNTVDDYEPPRYEKETHRGRANKGYDDETEEKPAGHGRRRHRDREDKDSEDRGERRERSRHRDRDAEPRGRHYSTEDNTDSRYDPNYGDPNMGTSI